MRRIAVALVLGLWACDDGGAVMEASGTSGGTEGEGSGESTGQPRPSKACALDFTPATWCEGMAECSSTHCGDRPQQIYAADDIRFENLEDWLRCTQTCLIAFEVSYERIHGSTTCLPDSARYGGAEEIVRSGESELDPILYWCTCYRPETTEPYVSCSASPGENVAEAPSVVCYNDELSLRPIECGVVATAEDGLCVERSACIREAERGTPDIGDPDICHAIYDDACAEMGL